jgi:hypothetical protein
MDSYLMLPSSLKNLCNSFNIPLLDSKSIFPFLLDNINYQGVVPDFKYFKGINLLEYENYKEQFNNKIWNFKEEAIAYCYLDCISLYQILIKFSQLIFDKFKLNITKYPTLPGLAYNLFKSRYLKKNTIHMLSGEIANNIRMGYTGGAVDMYLSKPIRNSQIYAYDVNSLYPFVMRENSFPVGPPTDFKGDILKIESLPFGFFYCKISSSSHIQHPILQAHVRGKEGTRSIFPRGNWEGMYFSEELYNAQKYGYQFEILWGYTFEKGYVFKDYVDSLYNLRLTYPKTDPMNMVAKLLLHSLYGRFGMDDSFINTKIIPKEDYLEFEGKIKEGIIDVLELKDSYLVQYKDPDVEFKTLLDNGREVHNVNIAIAAAVTAYARIHMSQFKNNNTLPRLYYTDTDSLYFDGPIPDHFINNKELGKLKLEGIYDDAVFLAPKVYGLKNGTTDGEIIKIKGLSKDSIVSNNINLETLDRLLFKDSNIQISQNKWFKHLDKGNISILEQIYTLKATGNKRDLVYNDEDKLIGSTPLHLVDGKLFINHLTPPCRFWS